MLMIHVLAGGELFEHVLKALSALMKQDDFFDLLRLTALIGIVMVTCNVIKTRNPALFAQWFLTYVLMTQVILIPKTSVLIDDISAQTPKLVDNVPVVFALGASLMTTIGYSLAQSYDALLSMPDDLRYTQTGSLFASRLIQASKSFRIIDPQLQAEMNDYFRVCVVGDIRLNHKYSVNDLMQSADLWSFISAHPSPLRHIPVNGKLVTCADASKPEGAYSLRQKLNRDMNKAYTFFGVNFFGKPKSTTYEQLFTTHLTSAFKYYQGLTDETSNIFLQSMMINALQEGITHYQAITDATAGIVNHQFTKAQLQQRWSWEIAGLKALWFLPLLHTWLTLLLFGIFPFILALTTLPSGFRIMQGYWQFFLSLQCWSLLFAILNAGMTIYGRHQSLAYGAPTLINLNQLEQVHQDLSAVTGYIMMLIPFLANGLVSNLSSAFSHLTSSLTSQVQSSTMAVAGEAASSSFSFGQTSFYNTTANTFSANKHDSNWTHLHGARTEQMDSGVLKTTTSQGDVIYDVSPAMSKTPIHVADSQSIAASFNQAYEQSKQAAHNAHEQYQTALSRFAHHAMSFSNLEGHDKRLGEGLSNQQSSQFTQAVSTMTQIAEDVAKRAGISKEDAFAAMTRGGHDISGGFSLGKTIPGRLLGIQGGWRGHMGYERSSTTAYRAHDGSDQVASAREMEDFNKARSVIEQIARTKHFDDTHSEGAQLLNQMGADLRDAQTASHNEDVSLTKAQRIQTAKQIVESKSAQITTDLNQAFPGYVASRLGRVQADTLFAHPGDLKAIDTLQALAHDFLQEKRDHLIAEYGEASHNTAINSFYKQSAVSVEQHENQLKTQYAQDSTLLQERAKESNVGIDEQKVSRLQKEAQSKINNITFEKEKDIQKVIMTQKNRFEAFEQSEKKGSYDATGGVIPGHAIDNAKEFLLQPFNNHKEKE